MDNLRLILLIIGCLIVTGIYLWEVFYNAAPKRKADILNAVDESPDLPLYPNNNSDVNIDDHSADALADIGSLLSQSQSQAANIDDTLEPFNISGKRTSSKPYIDEPDEDLPLDMSVNDYEASLSESENYEPDYNDPGIFAAIEEELYGKQESELETEVDSSPDEPEVKLELEEIEAEIPEGNQTNQDILVMYITSPSHISFNGLSISKAADEVGMIYGHMNIFHHFGPGKLHSGQPLFSLANMHEPGSFDLGRMSDLKTKGLAMFMYSPASIDASVVFELFLNTTQRLAELLGGVVRTSDNELLNNKAINSLREKAESLSV
ncbi:MAG TPA: cell division protein ZipA [Thiotrichaceae bacterium]|jgi:cell division protein ZipA|nr:cell division protein ZipA [Thiotrichaceae bacterium]HIM08606.1 cell division protein ZipA [Gammaproteobacteria bacterium]